MHKSKLKEKATSIIQQLLQHTASHICSHIKWAFPASGY